jgi:hypothetical protein
LRWWWLEGEEYHGGGGRLVVREKKRLNKNKQRNCSHVMVSDVDQLEMV